MKRLTDVSCIGKWVNGNEQRFDLSYLVDNGCGCGFMKSVTFIGKELKDVFEFLKELRAECDGCTVTARIYEGCGENQKRIV